MERIFIDREYAIAYVVMAIDSIWNSANKERKIEDFIDEIKTMTEIHIDEKSLLELKKSKMLEKYKIRIIKGRKWKNEMFKMYKFGYIITRGD